MRLLSIAILLVGAAAGWADRGGAAPLCRRAAATSDVFIDVKGDDVTILVANIGGSCIIVFPNSLRVTAEDDQRLPWYVYIRVEDSDGKILTRTTANSLLPAGWWSPMVLDSDEAVLSDLIELEPGELKAKRVSVGALLSGLDAVGMNLPRGRPLRLQLRVMLPPYPADLHRGGNASGVDVRTVTFIYSVPGASTR